MSFDARHEKSAEEAVKQICFLSTKYIVQKSMNLLMLVML